MASAAPESGDRLLVRFRAGAADRVAASELAAAGVEREREIASVPGLAVVRLAPAARPTRRWPLCARGATSPR